jgi:hypothetical protein
LGSHWLLQQSAFVDAVRALATKEAPFDLAEVER